MLQIGGRGRQAKDLVDALLDCHGRIRQMMEIARALVAAAPGAPAGEVREAAARVRRYFVEALPRHVEDEEASIAPRLRGRDPAVDAALAEMTAEHTRHDALVARLVALCRRLEAEPERLPEVQGELGEVTGALDAELAAHLAREEEVVFPAIRRLLDEGERAAIHAELRARRTSDR
ncbi:MAG TPA: hemerythrin domain-containing protein [Kofleriaceae bacterium]|nr:hemerythrin domain-containing protein [Kofleriaceae bacterium]